ncbi:MAG: xanthine dehydrogenase family protein subunit M, partial [Deltaproteobacteria bacterium]|nr:xanthine dehydrogenase family protein subunit M [Deltaproteobacteria bacterium]
LTEILIPDQPATGSTYIKFGLRRSGALAVVGVAVSLTVANGVVEDARVVLASSAPTVLRAREAEAFLKGKEASDAVFAEAGKLASGASRARTSIRGSADYRKHLAGVLTKRALRKALTGHA